MKIVIQCSARKQPNAKSFETEDGRRAAFVARPTLAPLDARNAYARPR